MSAQLEEIAAKLDGARSDGNGGFMAKCPTHDDRTPSLHLWIDEQGHLAYCCFAGCDHAAVGDVLGLTPDKRDDDDWTPRGPAIASYRYVDAHGRHLYTVCRTADKQFPCWRPDSSSKSGRAWNLNGQSRVLYRLPEVVRAVASGEDVWICEGEKDCDALHRAGVVATCNPGGAGKWRDEYSAWLRDAAVILVRDKDEPGVKHAAQVTAALKGIAASVLTVEAKVGKDACDHLAAGCAVEDFVPVPGAAPSPAAAMFIDWRTFWQHDHSEAEWAYPDVLARGRGHALYAGRKLGKSLLMLYIAAELATGSAPIVVLYLDFEMTEADVLERLEDMGYGPGSDLSRLCYALLPALPPLDTPEGALALTEVVDTTQQGWPEHHLVVIIDTISRAVRGEENSADTFRSFYNCTGIELKRRGITWMRLDHSGKDPAQGQRGSSGKGDDVDVVWRLAKTANGVCLYRDLARMAWVPEKVTFGMTEEPLAYRRLAGDWPVGTNETAEALDRLGMPLDVCVRTAQTALKAVDEGRRTEVVSAALRWRRERSGRFA